jgi:uncharacterized SAM-binding protein YcdF (DUF218 family)
MEEEFFSDSVPVRANYFRRLAVIYAVIAAVFFIVVLLWGGLKAADSLLVMRQKPCKSDVIVVLGGETKVRAAKVLELYRQGYAPRILVTGSNEESLITNYLTANGVPKNVIWQEADSTSTYENGKFTVPLLQQLNVKKALLVTSWYHSRRAYKVFYSISETIEFVSTPTDTEVFTGIIRDKRVLRLVLFEYVKIAGYWMKYGIWPFHNLGDVAG